jgi:autotransporter-associated beta strand protein
VFINNGSAFGTGPIDIPGTSSNDIPYVASYGGNPITVANPITVGSNGSTQGVTLGSITPSGNDMLILSGLISDENEDDVGIIAIGGPVTLNAANTYSGGTIFTGSGSAAAFIGNGSGFGSGPITIQDGAQIAPVGADIAFANPITLSSSPLELGNAGDAFMLTVNGVISGNGNLNITSNVTLNGLNTYTGGTLIDDANVIIGSSSPFGTGGVTLQDNATLSFSSSPTLNDLNGDNTAAINLTTGQVLTLVADSAGGSYSGAINGDMTNTVTKTGGGVQQLFGSATYGGGTDVNAGVLVVGAAGAVGVGMVTVATGAELDVADGAILTVPVTLSGSAILGGSGTFSPAAPFTFSGGGTVSPGIPIDSEYVSTLSFGSGVTFGTGGVYNLNVANAGGVAGTDYSTIFVNGTLTLTASPGSFMIALNSIGSGGGPGPAIFNPAQPYSMTILTTSSGITGFSPTLFTVTTTNFQNSLAGGSFAVGDSGDSLTLNFTPVPEPSTWALMLTGVGAVGAAIRRRRRS